MEMPSLGNNRLATSAPAIPTRISPMIPKPVPRTICPASQPAIRPTNRITRMLSLDMRIKISPRWLRHFSPLLSNLSTIGCRDHSNLGALQNTREPPTPNETFTRVSRYAGMTQPDIWYVAYGPDKTVKTDDSASGVMRTTRTFKTEVDAKLFAMQILAKGWTVSAGTLNPHLPKQIVGPSQIERWADPDLGD